MNQTLDLQKLSYVTSVLHSGLPEKYSAELSSEVIDALRFSREQMSRLPMVIEDLEAARTQFDRLGQAIDRLRELAEEAARLPDEERVGRKALEAEFIDLAHIVAEIAGRKNYLGPELSLRTKAQAQAALKILRHLIPFKDQMFLQIQEQEALIFEAVSETLSFLETIVECYPEAASVTSIPDLLHRVVWIRRQVQPGIQAGAAPTGGLH